MKVLGIDQATSCGWAILSSGQVLEAGAWDLSIRTKATKTIEADAPVIRLLKLKDRLTEVLTTRNIDLVCYEKVTGGMKVGGAAGNLARHLEAVLMLTCHVYHMPLVNFAAGTIKKHATGDGSWKTKKEHMEVAARQRWADFMRSVRTDMDGLDDMVDAMWIADLGGYNTDHNWE